MKTSLKSFALFAVFATAASSQAALLVYEDFQGSNYVAGNSFIGVTAQGTGLTGNWAQATADANQNWTVGNTTSMSYSAGSGGTAVNINGGTKYAIGNYTGGTGAEAAHIQLASGLASTTGNTFYMSFLFRMSGALDVNDQIMLDVANTNSVTPVSKFGFRDNTPSPTGDAFFVGSATGGAYMTTPAPTMSTTYFGVVKFTTAVNTWDLATLYINPTSTAVEGGAGTVSFDLASLANTSINYFGLRLQQADATDFLNIDEVRIGDSWSSVVVPEPATWALLAVVGTFFMITRRRKMNG